MRLEEVGELGLIERIKSLIGDEGRDVLLGIGDDAAALKLSPHKITLLTTDTLVEGIHFDLQYMDFYHLGWRSIAANLSDIAAMGGEPLYAVISLCLPRDLSIRSVEEFYRGAKELADRYGVGIVGGDSTGSGDGIVVSIALIGQVEEGHMTSRSGARVRDLICVTGDLGKARAGLKILRSGDRGLWRYKEVIERHRMPEPRVKEAQALVENLRIHSMIDISDGLASEIHHICRSSGVGALLYEEKIPISPAVKEVAEFFGDSPMDYVLSGGEDFELLFTIGEEDLSALKGMEKQIGCSLSLVGRILAKEEGIKMLGRAKRISELRGIGYDHFSKT